MAIETSFSSLGTTLNELAQSGLPGHLLLIETLRLVEDALVLAGVLFLGLKPPSEHQTFGASEQLAQELVYQQLRLNDVILNDHHRQIESIRAQSRLVLLGTSHRISPQTVNSATSFASTLLTMFQRNWESSQSRRLAEHSDNLSICRHVTNTQRLASSQCVPLPNTEGELQLQTEDAERQLLSEQRRRIERSVRANRSSKASKRSEEAIRKWLDSRRAQLGEQYNEETERQRFQDELERRRVTRRSSKSAPTATASDAAAQSFAITVTPPVHGQDDDENGEDAEHQVDEADVAEHADAAANASSLQLPRQMFAFRCSHCDALLCRGSQIDRFYRNSVWLKAGVPLIEPPAVGDSPSAPQPPVVEDWDAQLVRNDHDVFRTAKQHFYPQSDHPMHKATAVTPSPDADADAEIEEDDEYAAVHCRKCWSYVGRQCSDQIRLTYIHTA